MAGFPPPSESLVTLANWQEPPFNRWSFKHLREVIPTHRIAARHRLAGASVARPATALDDVEVTRLGSGPSTLGAVLADTWTDAVVVMHDGKVVLERYFAGMRPNTPHLLMSVSKSIVGCVAGILAAQGLLDTDAPITDYVPEIEGSGYDGATVRHLLDMRTGVAFSETYDDPDAEVRVMERHMGWRPTGDEGCRGMYAYLASLAAGGPHGGEFVYRSADTDMLGWVCERAAGTRMADLISTLIWRPMGAEFDAEITCDVVGSPVHDGGVCATARDLARFGQLLLDDGRVGQDRQWSRTRGWRTPGVSMPTSARHSRRRTPNRCCRVAGTGTSSGSRPGPSGDIQLCLGIHGQMVLVDHSTRTVAVKVSSWPEPQDVANLVDTIRAFTAAGRHLAGLGSAAAATTWPTGPSGLVEGRERGHS